jgi:ABC-2 type transport system ATP-binding protein
MQALSLRQLTKTYRNGVQALKGIDLDVGQGDFFALLGPNGAGKTTAIGIIASLVNKTSGTVRVFGHDIDTDLELAKSCLGLVPQEINFNQFEKVSTILVNQAGFYGIPRGVAKERMETWLHKLQLWDKRDAVSRTLSGGMKRRLMIARALIHEPRLLILDEPFNGLDPEARLQLMEMLRKLADGGVKIIVSSHILGEIAQLTDRILLLFRGRLLAEGSVAEIRELLDRHPVELRLSADDARAVARWAVEQGELVGLRLEEGSAVLAVRNPRTFLPRLQDAVVAGTLPLTALDPLDLNLDAVFQYLTKDHA